MLIVDADESPLRTERSAHRMPYFRWFGKTAIVPGYKQMVVDVGEHQHPEHPNTAPSSRISFSMDTNASGSRTNNPRSTEKIDEEIPFYNPADPAPNHPLIRKLVQTFFTTHDVGCNFPFLHREKFTRDVERKKADIILVDAVCAIAARFCDDPLFGRGHRTLAGSAFMARAKSRVVDTFACPSLPAVQACVLLAYAEFGCARDSGLWMFLGIAIRMAQDLGLQKIEGLRGEQKIISCGRKRPRSWSLSTRAESDYTDYRSDANIELAPNEIEDPKEMEHERTVTFWSVFFLDRVISSGTGRPVTLRHEEIEVSLPPVDYPEDESTFPQPFPALIRVIHLYGQATDCLNNTKHADCVTPELMHQLSMFETDLNKLYSGFSKKLHFNLQNFQHYVKTNQASVFLLLHFWFHTLIILLHRPTLFGFKARIGQLCPNSRELSMSSAKTVADIVAFAELLDVKAVSGNPFTSQPIYIAACAFLQELRIEAVPPEPMASPTLVVHSLDGDNLAVTDSGYPSPMASEDNTHTSITAPEVLQTAMRRPPGQILLAQAAQQNYQRCYNAVKSIGLYWAGVGYILNVLRQKSKGIANPLLYTNEEHKAEEAPKSTTGSFVDSQARDGRRGANGGILVPENHVPSNLLGLYGDLSQGTPSTAVFANANKKIAIGWSVTGTTDSPSGNLSFLYPTPDTTLTDSMRRSFAAPNLPMGELQQTAPKPDVGILQYPPTTIEDYSSAKSEAEMLLELSGVQCMPRQPTTPTCLPPDATVQLSQAYNTLPETGYGNMFGVGENAFGIMLESEGVNVNALGVDTGSWLGYLPEDGSLRYYDQNTDSNQNRR